MNRKNYYQEKGNGANGSSGPSKAPNELLKKIAALEKSQYFLQNIIDLSTDALLRLDDQKKIISINLAAEKLLNVPRETLLGKVINDIIPESDLNIDDAIRIIRHKVGGIAQEHDLRSVTRKRVGAGVTIGLCPVCGDADTHNLPCSHVLDEGVIGSVRVTDHKVAGVACEQDLRAVC